eukprot:7918493-Ditylum_brightwellii.AAC.1
MATVEKEEWDDILVKEHNNYKSIMCTRQYQRKIYHLKSKHSGVKRASRHLNDPTENNLWAETSNDAVLDRTPKILWVDDFLVVGPTGMVKEEKVKVPLLFECEELDNMGDYVGYKVECNHQ